MKIKIKFRQGKGNFCGKGVVNVGGRMEGLAWGEIRGRVQNFLRRRNLQGWPNHLENF
jgi:hypothetical protein